MFKTVLPIEYITIEEAKEYESLFFTFQQQLCFSEEECAKAVSIAVGVCRHCWSDDNKCQCWNDE